MLEQGQGVTRRDLLRRTGGVAVATVWMVPVVHSIGGTAVAAAASPPPTGVLPTKQGQQPDTDVEGTKLPRTGSSLPLTEVAVIGAGVVATGVAVRRLTRAAPVDVPVDVLAADTPGDQQDGQPQA